MPKSLPVANMWGDLRQFAVPYSVVHDGVITSNPPALSVLLVLYRNARVKPNRPVNQEAVLRISSHRLMELTGFSKDKITEATKELQSGFARRLDNQGRNKRGRFGSSSFVLLHPSLGTPLTWGDSSNLLYSANIPYFPIPQCLISEIEAPWSLAHVGKSPSRVYVALCWKARQYSKTHYELPAVEVERLAGVKRQTFVKALARLETLGLIQCEQTGQSLAVALCDPYTRQPLHEKQVALDARDDLANYRAVNDKGISRKLNLNTADPERARSLLLTSLPPKARIVEQPSNGGVMILCPFHTERTPSCSVSFDKQVFHCFGCKQKGILRQLIMHLRECSLQEVVKLEAEAAGLHAEYRDPDAKAVALYDYLDKKGKRVKQVRRFVDPSTGKKTFDQWKSTGGGTRRYKDVPKLLFNLHRLEYARTVCVVEGEKDACTITNLNLKCVHGSEVIATTSGGAETWQDAFANDLVGKRVIICPDADEQGAAYAAKVAASLDARGIEYRVVDFSTDGVKDVSEYLEAENSVETLVRKLGTDWVSDGTPEEPEPYVPI